MWLLSSPPTCHHSGDQVREFAYVALAEDAVELLSAQAGLSEPVNLVPEDHPIIGEQALESYCDRVQNGSIMDNLLAAMSSASLKGKASHEDYPPVSTLEKTSGLTLGFMPDVTGHIRRMVSTIYSSHKIGRREPSERFLRVSKRHDQQSQEANLPTVWPATGRIELKGGDGVLLIHSSADDLTAKVPKWCYYLLNGSVEISDGWKVVQTVDETFRDRLKYFVRCRDVTVESVRTYNDYTRAGVALGDVGWYHQEDFLKWLAHLTTYPRISSPVQVPQAYPGDLDPSRWSRKRQSDVIFIDDDDDAKRAPSKRQKRTFRSDSITDAEYQQLLEENYFGGGSRSNEPESGE
jgi:hypothetical protein